MSLTGLTQRNISGCGFGSSYVIPKMGFRKTRLKRILIELLSFFLLNDLPTTLKRQNGRIFTPLYTVNMK